MKQFELRQIIREEISKVVKEINVKDSAAGFMQDQKVGCWAANGKTSEFIHKKLSLPQGNIKQSEIDRLQKKAEKEMEKNPKYCQYYSK
jgi:hypothetical protein